MVYVADNNCDIIRKITPQGNVTTLTTLPVPGLFPPLGFSFPQSVAIDGRGNLFVADTTNNVIRLVLPNGTLSTYVGSGFGAGPDNGGTWADGVGTYASFYAPAYIHIALDGTLFVADSANFRIRRVSPLGAVTTIAGDGTESFLEGYGTASRFAIPQGISAVAPLGNTLYIADSEELRIRALACVPCPAAYSCSSGVPALCPAGSYCPLGTPFLPLPCPQGTYCPVSGATSSDACLACPPGVPCPPGSAQPGTNSVTATASSSPTTSPTTTRCPSGSPTTTSSPTGSPTPTTHSTVVGSATSTISPTATTRATLATISATATITSTTISATATAVGPGTKGLPQQQTGSALLIGLVSASAVLGTVVGSLLLCCLFRRSAASGSAAKASSLDSPLLYSQQRSPQESGGSQAEDSEMMMVEDDVYGEESSFFLPGSLSIHSSAQEPHSRSQGVPFPVPREVKPMETLTEEQLGEGDDFVFGTLATGSQRPTPPPSGAQRPSQAPHSFAGSGGSLPSGLQNPGAPLPSAGPQRPSLPSSAALRSNKSMSDSAYSELLGQPPPICKAPGV